jgi:thiol-disulfide isomerase/thioredoxin
MMKPWGKMATVGVGAAVLLMGAGIWRSTLQAGEAPRVVSASTAKDTAPADPPTAGDASEETPAAKGGAEAEFAALMVRLKEKAKGATDDAKKQVILDEIIAELQKFSAAHQGDAAADQAQMALGQLQIRMGKAAEAIVTFRGVAEHGATPAIKRPAEFMMAQALALAGQMDAAKAKLSELAPLVESGKTPQEKEVGKASKNLLVQLSQETAVQAGAKPPAFTAKDLAGVTHSLEQYKGKVVLIDFWATWCGPCRAELPLVKAVYEKYRDRGLVLLGVSLDENKGAVEKFVQSQGMAWPQLYDGQGWKNEIARLYGVTAIPRAVLIDREGNIRHAAIRGHEMDRAIAELLP